MRYSNLVIIAGMIATTLTTSMAGKKTNGPRGLFCGYAPADWVPPGQKRRPDHRDSFLCHLLMREQRAKNHLRAKRPAKA